MSTRMAIGAAVAGLAVGIGGVATIGGAQIGGAQVGAPRQLPEAPAIGAQTPRARVALEIARMLREGVEADTDQIVASLPAPGELAERRREIAQQLMDFALVKFVEPPSPTAQRGTFHAAIEDYMEWSSKRLDATLDLAESDDDRRAAIAGEVATLRQVEAIYRDLAENEPAFVTPQNLMALEFARLEQEMKLARFVGERAGG